MKILKISENEPIRLVTVNEIGRVKQTKSTLQLKPTANTREDT